MASASTYRPLLTTRKLLVSVQNANEALLAFQCGVPWVDLKNPAAGSLGQPSAETCEAFVRVARQFPDTPISVALGEFDRVDWQWVRKCLPEFAVGKVGLAGRSRLDNSLIEVLASFKGKIVPALYADWSRADAPSPEDVLQLVRMIEAPYLLVDTFIKDGSSLLNWMSLEQLRELQITLQSIGAGLVVAGSLRKLDWPTLEQLSNIVVGVRGAVCQEYSDRSSQLDQAAIGQWLDWATG